MSFHDWIQAGPAILLFVCTLVLVAMVCVSMLLKFNRQQRRYQRSQHGSQKGKRCMTGCELHGHNERSEHVQ